jgi:putative ABC transport system permease protein
MESGLRWNSRRILSMRTLLHDLEFGLRMLAKNPSFTAVAVLTLALGIGANTAIFSVVNGVLLNPLPYCQPDRLVALYARTPESSRWSISYPNFQDWIRNNRSFSSLAGYRMDAFNLTGTDEPERVPAEMISASFFPLLGVRPVIGRTFRPEEDQSGAAPVVLISEGLWKRKFGASPDALGKSLLLNGTPYIIVGVIPADFHFDSNNNFQRSDVYVPIGQWTNPMFLDRRAPMGMDAVGRLKPSVTLEQARADMDSLAQHLAEQYPDADKGMGITLLPLKQNEVGEIRPFLLVLLGAVGFVLLIACVNVANLLLARSTRRAHEFAIRSALGAGRGRLVRQLLTESLMLALAGGGLGLLIASWGLQGALKVLPEALPRAEEIHLDVHVLVFTLGASILAGILFGLAPALKNSQRDLHDTLKTGGRGASGARHRAQGIFVVVETALALVLLAGAGLMIRSLTKLLAVDPGFNPHHVLTFRLALPPDANKTPEVTRATWRALEDRVLAIPGVQSASLTVGAMPMAGDSEVRFWLEDQPKPSTQAEMKQATFYTVQPGYPKVMGIPLKRGRFFSSADNEHSPVVTVIDDRFAQLIFGNDDPIGKHVNFDLLNASAVIVGVVGHVKQWGLDSDATSPLQAQCYFQLTQIPDSFATIAANYTGIMLRTAASPMAQVGSVRRALDEINSQQVMYNVRTMDNIISESLAARRFSMMLLGIFAALALVMSCVGIYGVISYLAGERTHEIGIRMALGAARGDMLWMVLGEGTKMAALGIAIGLVVALGMTRLMANMLFGVSPHDPLSFVAVAGLLILVTLAACAMPALRATRVDPVVALRYE